LLPVNYRIFAFDLDAANQEGQEPDWQLFTDYAKDYDLAGGVSVDSMYDLARRLTEDEDLYWNVKWDFRRRATTKHVGTTDEWQKNSMDAFCYLTSVHDREYENCIGAKYHFPTDTLIGKWKTT
jgi:hypothetical protein